MLEWWQYVLLGGAGLLGGFIDAVAGGGGLITIPALLWAGLPPQVALGTNKLQSSCGTTLAVWHYRNARLVRVRPLALGIAVTFLASVAGTWTVTRIDASFLRSIIPVLLLAIAAWMTWKPQIGVESRPPRMSQITFAIIFGSALGFYDGFFGPGVGSFWMVACVMALGLDLPRATGQTKVMNLTSNLASLVVFLPAGLVRFDVGAAMIIGQLAGARLGARLVILRGAKFIRPVFLAAVILLAARLLFAR